MRAGKVEVLYENGYLRYFRIGKTEVLRMIYFAIRDANWGNYEPIFYNEKIEEKEDSFQINYNVKYTENGQDFFNWRVVINGFSSNEIHFEIFGETTKEFRTNRAGFCILHPIEKIAGEKVKIEHSNNEKIDYIFPKFISPYQPFIDISSMKWSVENNDFELVFEGDIFETEDQRNWGDASYKTYCTPLSLPFPKQMKVGDKVHQKVVFKAKLNNNNINDSQNQEQKTGKFDIGLCETTSIKPLTEKSIEKLKSLELSHYRIEVYTIKAGWKEVLKNQITISKTLELPLEIVLILGEKKEKEIEEFLNTVLAEKLNIKYLLLLNQNELVTNQITINLIPNLKVSFTNSKIGVGTNYNFTELNRNRFDAKAADFISISFDPQVHANDDLTIMENAETVKYLVETAMEIYKKPVHISPILLKRRFNPYATDPKAINIPIENQVDSRQQSDFLANWVDVLIKNLKISGVESITLFQTHGQLGIMDENGEPFPVFENLKPEKLRK